MTDAHLQDVVAATELHRTIGELLRDAVPDAPDVAEKAKDIIERVEGTGRVTVGQLEALRNMRDGMVAWMRDW